MVTFKQSGDFRRVTSYFERLKEVVKLGDLDKVGKQGVAALQAATPIDTGDTANSWYYDIVNKGGVATITFYNSNIENGCPVAIILQYGHGLKNGGWVEGIDYINPALEPIFNELVEEAWKEVTTP